MNDEDIWGDEDSTDPEVPDRNESTIPDGCPDRQAAVELVRLMREMSEDYWAAGWLIGLETELWQCAFEDPNADFGFGPISFQERARLIELSHRCQGWWCWDESGRGERFVTLDEWLPRYQDDVK